MATLHGKLALVEQQIIILLRRILCLEIINVSQNISPLINARLRQGIFPNWNFKYPYVVGLKAALFIIKRFGWKLKLTFKSGLLRTV